MESVELGLAKLAEIRECVDAIAVDGAKFFDKGNKAAGVRARKALQDLKTLAQQLRVAIQKCKSESAHARLVEQSQQNHSPLQLLSPLSHAPPHTLSALRSAVPSEEF